MNGHLRRGGGEGGAEARRTYRTESDSSSGQAYQAAVACMRLMDGICILIA